MAKVMLQISVDEELNEAVRQEAERLNQPLSWYVRKILEKAVWPDRHSQSGLHPTLKDPAANGTAP